MIRPISFDLNEQTMASNAFQKQKRDESKKKIRAKALKEFDAFVKSLKKVGVNVIVINDTPLPFTPDSIFPNNWVSFHNDATVVLYPMQAPNRRQERRNDIIELLQTQYNFKVKYAIDMSINNEPFDRFLEGTGSMVLDRAHKKTYACISPRTHPKTLADWCDWSEYTPIVFTAVDQQQQQIYHTNVLMCIGDTFAVICLSAIPNEQERLAVTMNLQNDGHEIIDISYEQMNCFAGNMLQVCNQANEKVLVMSKAAHNSLNENQLQQLEKHNDHLVLGDIRTIEKYGGGSTRCMMAEVFLPLSETEKKKHNYLDVGMFSLDKAQKTLCNNAL